MKLRIHHFFDIIRDFGLGKEIKAHVYQHSYHKVAGEILENPELELELIVGCDAVCEGCIHLTDNSCDDKINHRKDFTSKEAFNNYLDKRIMEICYLDISEKYSPKLLVKKAGSYLQNIEYIYEGNDAEHTAQRKKNVLQGLRFYSRKHTISFDLLD